MREEIVLRKLHIDFYTNDWCINILPVFSLSKALGLRIGWLLWSMTIGIEKMKHLAEDLERSSFSMTTATEMTEESG